MGAPVHFAGKGTVGRHTTVIDIAKNVVEALQNRGATVSCGFITAGIGAKTRSLTMTNGGGCFEINVVGPSSKQVLKVYGIDLLKFKETIYSFSGKRGFKIRDRL